MYSMWSYAQIPYLRISAFSWGFFCRILPWKTATKFKTKDTIYENVSWRRAVEFKPGVT